MQWQLQQPYAKVIKSLTKTLTCDNNLLEDRSNKSHSVRAGRFATRGIVRLGTGCNGTTIGWSLKSCTIGSSIVDERVLRG